MTHEEFKNLLEELDGTGSKLLAEKNARYSSSNDALQNFHEGAEIMGCTTAQACWGYMTKHLSALRKMIWTNDFYNREDVYEKCIDTINYVRFLWAISEEERNKLKITDCEETQEQPIAHKSALDEKYPVFDGDEHPLNCVDCKYFENSSVQLPCSACNYAHGNNYYPLRFSPRDT
jgi:hypothetical protein